MIAEDPGQPDGRLLLDESGREIARFREALRHERRVADRLTVAVEPGQAVPVVMTELAGWRVTADEPFGRLLVAAGGHLRRHVYAMSRDLVRDPAPRDWLEPPVPAGVRLTGVDRPAIDLAPACLAAYPREHPDYEQIPTPERPELELEELMSGRMMGPLLGCSGLAVGEEGAVLGAVLITASHREPPLGGRGSHSSSAVRRRAGSGVRCCSAHWRSPRVTALPAVGLAVTHGNPARALYDATGFAAVSSTLTVEL